MNIEKCLKKGDVFKLSFEEKIKPVIEKKLENEMKVVLSEKYIKDILNVSYNIDNLYIKIRNLLVETDLNISIRRRDKEFVFYKVLDDISKESDIFRLAIKNKLIPYLIESLMIRDSISFEENLLKEFLYVNDYNNLYITNTIRSEMPNEIKIKFIKDSTNKFMFYCTDLKKKIREKKIEIRKKEIQRKRDLKDSILMENRKILSNVGKALESYPKVEDKIEIIPKGNPSCICPNCKEGVIEYPNLICPVCKVECINKWDL